MYIGDGKISNWLVAGIGHQRRCYRLTPLLFRSLSLHLFDLSLDTPATTYVIAPELLERPS
jgi:hypothetical protein